MKKRVVIGIGTGRCGTVSLCNLINLQTDSNITHEMRPLLPWKTSYRQINQRMETILSRNEFLVGDVAFFYLPYVEYILENYPGSKIICLKRKRSEVVNSYLNKTKGRNHWVQHRGLIWKHCEWDKCYPKYNTILKSSALKKYWNNYYEKAEAIMAIYPQRMIIADMNYALNTNEGVYNLLTFIGVNEEQIVIKKNIKKNMN